MSEHPPGAGGFPYSREQFPGAAGVPPSWPSTLPRGQSRTLTFVALAVAFAASGLAIAGWFLPSRAAAPTPPAAAGPMYTEQQISEAKARICDAFDVVQKSIKLQTGAGDPGLTSSDNPAMTEAQSANARLAVVAGAAYLRHRTDPATPSEIADAVRILSESMSDLSEKYLAGAQNDDPEVSKLRSDGSSMAAHLAELCK